MYTDTQKEIKMFDTLIKECVGEENEKENLLSRSTHRILNISFRYHIPCSRLFVLLSADHENHVSPDLQDAPNDADDADVAAYYIDDKH